MGFLANPIIVMLVQAGLTYGPTFVSDIEKILNNPNATVADVVAAFSSLKPYSAYNIPNIPAQVAVPTPTVTIS